MSWINCLSSLARRGWRSGLVSAAIITFGLTNVNAQAINEGFEDLATLLTQDWSTKNQSDPINPASPGWFQCPENGTQINPADKGPENSCVASNFASGTGTATISTWLIAPTRTFNNGDTIKFWTREIADNIYPNRMLVRLSTNGASTDTGSSATSVGDFGTVLLEINPDLKVGGYPFEWTEYIITIADLTGPTSGRFAFHFSVPDGGPSGANSYIIGIDTLSYTPGSAPAPPQHVVDFNGDGKTDFAHVRNTGGGPGGQMTWFVQNNGAPSVKYQADWGLDGDTYVPADFDGDNSTDIAVWRGASATDAPEDSYFYILNSLTGTFSQIRFGVPGDNAKVTRDYTGDGKADPAAYRSGALAGDPSYWYFLPSDGPFAGQVLGTQWGQNGDFPAPGDYNGDGKADFQVQRNNGSGQAAFIRRNGTGGPDSGGATDFAVVFGIPTDNILPGDYDGDGATDIAVSRAEGSQLIWYILQSSDGDTREEIWGNSATDFWTQGDYDGDGRTDIAVFRPDPNPEQNYFYILGSNGSTPIAQEFGQQGDYPVANYDRF